jgi:hypothetical protein
MRRTGVYLLALLLACIVSVPLSAEAKKKECTNNTFVCGYDYGKAFLGAKKEKGKKYRKNIWKGVQRFKSYFWKYMRDEMIPAASRALLESRFNWWSRTKDTTIHESGLMSNGYDFTRKVCLEYGVCGDPCGDPEFSIALAGFRRYLARKQMIEDAKNDDGGDSFWFPWLMKQFNMNRFEAEVIIGACGAINCQKLRMAIKYAGTNDEKRAMGKDDVLHVWWKTINYLRNQDQAKINEIFYPKDNLWQIGSRVGRVVAQLFMRVEFYEQPQPHNGDDPGAFYGWDDEEFAYFPFRVELTEGENGVPIPTLVPDFPEPLYPTGPKFMPFSEWRKRCILYNGKSKAWRKATGEIKNCKAKYKKSACRDGVCWKKGQRKYPTAEDCEAAKAAWKAEMQDAGVLPTDEMDAKTDAEMLEAGYILVNPVSEE